MWREYEGISDDTKNCGDIDLWKITTKSRDIETEENTHIES